MKFTTLQPKHATSGPGKHRPSYLVNDLDDPTVQLEARVLRTTDGDELLRIAFWSRDLGWAAIGVSDRGDLLGLPTRARWKDASADLARTLELKGYEVIEDDYSTLFTPTDLAFDAERRSSVMVDDPGRWQISGKLLTPKDPEETQMVQVRVWAASLGWAALVLTTHCDVVAHTVGATEKASWKAAEAVMRRKGYLA